LTTQLIALVVHKNCFDVENVGALFNEIVVYKFFNCEPFDKQTIAMQLPAYVTMN